MSIAADIYFELTQAKLAPDVPFCAAPDQWREALSRGIGDAQYMIDDMHGIVRENAELEEALSSARSDASIAKAERNEWKRKFEAAIKEPVTA
jgi:hypothetical protein